MNVTSPAVVEPISAEEYAQRRERLRALAAERGLDGVLVVSRGANGADWGADIVYLTNHYSAFPQIPDRPGRWTGRGFSGLVMPANVTARSSSRSRTGARIWSMGAT